MSVWCGQYACQMHGVSELVGGDAAKTSRERERKTKLEILTTGVRGEQFPRGKGKEREGMNLLCMRSASCMMRLTWLSHSRSKSSSSCTRVTTRRWGQR